MLLRFQTSNHRSILDPVESHDRGGQQPRCDATLRPAVWNKYLPPPESTGPTLPASPTCSTHSRGCPRPWPPPCGAGTRASLATLTASVRAQGLRLRSTWTSWLTGWRFSYQLKLDDSAVLYESLCCYPERRRRTLFERNGNEIAFRRGLEEASGIRGLLTSTTLAISAGTRLGDSQLSGAGRAIAGISVVGLRPPRGSRLLLPRPGRSDSTRRLFLEDPGDFRERVLDLPERRIAALDLLRMATQKSTMCRSTR